MNKYHTLTIYNMECISEFDVNGNLMYHTTVIFNGMQCGVVVSKYDGTYNYVNNGTQYDNCEKYSLMIYNLSSNMIPWDFYKISSNQWTNDDYKKLFLVTTDTRKNDYNCDHVKVIFSPTHIMIKDDNKVHVYGFDLRLIQTLTIANTITRIKITGKYLIVENTYQKDDGNYVQLNGIYEIGHNDIQQRKTLETPILFIDGDIIITLKSDGEYSYNIQNDIYGKMNGNVLCFKNNICHVHTQNNKIKLYYRLDKKREINYTDISDDED